MTAKQDADPHQLYWPILLLSKRRTRNDCEARQIRKDCHQTAPLDAGRPHPKPSSRCTKGLPWTNIQTGPINPG